MQFLIFCNLEFFLFLYELYFVRIKKKYIFKYIIFNKQKQNNKKIVYLGLFELNSIKKNFFFFSILYNICLYKFYFVLFGVFIIYNFALKLNILLI